MTAEPRRTVTPGPGESDDPLELMIELIQRGRLRLDVAAVDLAASEVRLGLFHETTWYFRQALAEARRSWEALRAQHGTRALESALSEEPRTVLRLPNPRAGGAEILLVPIGGTTYRVEPVKGTHLAPAQWRLTRIGAEPGEDPYYAVRRSDGELQCDCGEWTFRVAGNDDAWPCKHLAGLRHLGWL